MRSSRQFLGLAWLSAPALAVAVSCGGRSALELEDGEGVPDAAPKCAPASDRWLAIRAAPANDETKAVFAVRVTNDGFEVHRLSKPEQRTLPEAVWSREGALLAFATLDEADQATTHVFRMDCAGPVPVIDVSGSMGAWGHDGVLAVSTHDPYTLWLVDPNGAAIPRRIDGTQTSLDYAFSPRTRQIALFGATQGAFLLDYSKPEGELQSLFSEKARYPVWAPHAAHLVFQTWTAGLALGVVNGAAMSAIPVLADASGYSSSYSPKLSDSGRWLAFRSLTSSQGPDLLVVEIAAAHLGKPTKIIANPGGRPDGFAFTPDERAIVFAERAHGELLRGLYVLELPPNGTARQLNPTLAPHEQITFFVDAWVRDGAELIYRITRKDDEEFELYRLAYGTPNAIPLEVSIALPSGHSVKKIDVAPGGRQLLLRAGPHVAGGLSHVAHAVLDAEATAVSTALGLHEAGASSRLAIPDAAGRSAFVYIDQAGDIVLQRVSPAGLEDSTVLWRPRSLELGETFEWQPLGS